MRYSKPPLSLDDQAALLLARGLSGDPDQIKRRLAAVNYYRLSGYSFPFRDPNDPAKFLPGTSFDEIWQRYVFDRLLRLLVMDAVERIEVSVRSHLAYHHAHTHGCFAYAENRSSLPGISDQKYAIFISKVENDYNSSPEQFVDHFRRRYGSHHLYLPVWMATELMAFGSVLTFYRGVTNPIKASVASEFRVHHQVFDSWLLMLNTVRNICAHHGRLWNRTIGTKPVVPKRDLRWKSPFLVPNDKVFGVLTTCRHCLLEVAPQSQWRKRLDILLSSHPQIPHDQMGFLPNWRESPLWK